MAVVDSGDALISVEVKKYFRCLVGSSFHCFPESPKVKCAFVPSRRLQFVKNGVLRLFARGDKGLSFRVPYTIRDLLNQGRVARPVQEVEEELLWD